ncbi:MAG: DNRLRE domain-containing protein [Chloroflexi bacterium]|nr:DNRLRE domain-containing protein [Chloroflexota bacterium]
MNPPSHDSYARNLLELYRTHRDEIDSLSDPTVFFILGLVNHVGKVTLDDLARDVNLAPNELRVKLVSLLRGKLIQDAKGTLTVTALGAQLLKELGFPIQPVPASTQPRSQPRPQTLPRGAPQPVPARRINWGMWIGVAATIVLFFAIGGGAVLIALSRTPIAMITATPILISTPTSTSTSLPTDTPITPVTVAPFVPSPTPTPSSAPSPTLTRTPSLTVTPSRTPTRTRTPTITLTAVPTTITLPAVEDAFVTSTCGASSPNNTTQLNVASNSGDPDCPGAKQRALLRFGLKLPANYAILQAKLNVHVMTATSGTTRIGVHRLTGAWSQTAVTWNNQPGRTAMYDNVSVGGEGWYTWDVTKMVEEWHTDAQPDNGLVLMNTSENLSTINYRAFNSNEHLNRALRPYLQITYRPR